ncbi:MAG: hypothetical protein AAGB04_00080 [Pseudomonadota bacterium]
MGLAPNLIQAALRLDRAHPDTAVAKHSALTVMSAHLVERIHELY